MGKLVCFFLYVVVLTLSTSNTFSQRFDTIAPTNDLREYFGDYRGTLGKEKIGMLIGPNDSGGLSGYYFFDTDIKDKHLTGEILGNRRILLRTTDSTSEPVRFFELHFLEYGTEGYEKGLKLSNQILYGVSYVSDKLRDSVKMRMQRPVYGLSTRYYRKNKLSKTELSYPDNSTRYGIAGGGISDSMVEKNIQAFYNAVFNKDSGSVSDYISYPLTVTFPSGKDIRVKSEKELFRRYGQIFTSKLINFLKDHPPHDLFVNEQGIMIGNGDIWFEGNGHVMAIRLNHLNLDNN